VLVSKKSWSFPGLWNRGSLKFPNYSKLKPSISSHSKPSISSHSKPCTRSHTRCLKCFVLEHSVFKTKHLRCLVSDIIQGFELEILAGLKFKWAPWSSRVNLVLLRTFRALLFYKTVWELFCDTWYNEVALQFIFLNNNCFAFCLGFCLRLQPLVNSCMVVLLVLGAGGNQELVLSLLEAS
jgi:hypothetical protein